MKKGAFLLAVLAFLGLCTIMVYLWLKATWDIPEISGTDSKRLDAIKKAFTNMAEKADRIFMDK